MVVVVARRAMEVLIRQRSDPAGDPPVLIPFSASVALEQSRPIFGDLCVLQILLLSFSCCNNCCRDPLRICVVCLKRQTGNPSGPGDSGPGAPRGDGSASDAKKAKCVFPPRARARACSAQKMDCRDEGASCQCICIRSRIRTCMG